jgi:hypothetical protein
MLKMLRHLCLLLLAFNACSFVHAETLTFNDLTSQPVEFITADNYGPLAFYFFGYVGPPFEQPQIPNDPTQFLFTGYYPFEPPDYSYQALLDQNGTPFYSSDYASFFTPSGNPFTLNSLLVAADEPAPILGYRKGVLVDQSSTSAANSDALLTLNWTNIDAVFFMNSTAGHVLDIDNVRIDEPVGPAASTPEPSTVLLLGSGLLGLFTIVRRKLEV